MATAVSVPTKTFDGKRYHLHGVYRSDNHAKNVAAGERSKGMNARVESEHVFDHKLKRVIKEHNVWVRRP